MVASKTNIREKIYKVSGEINCLGFATVKYGGLFMQTSVEDILITILRTLFNEKTKIHNTRNPTLSFKE